MTPEKKIQNEIMAALGTNDRLRLWRQNTGVFRALHGEEIIKVGINGAADLSGILYDGRRLEIEVKSATGKTSKEQERWIKMIRNMNGVAIVARSAQDAIKQLRDLGCQI